MVSCFHSSDLVEVMHSKSLCIIPCKSKKIVMINEPNSLGADLVGVDGSMSGLVVKVTVFAGVRTNSFAVI